MFQGWGTDSTAADDIPSDASAKPIKNPGIFRDGGGGFDPSALESAVQLLLEIPRGIAGVSKLHQIIKDEELKRKEHSDKVVELKEYSKKVDQQIRSIEYEESRAINNLKNEHERKVEEYRDHLRRKLDADARAYEDLEKKKQLQMADEAAAREDQIRRQTLEYAAQLRQKTDLLRVKAETEGGIRAERLNHDIRMEQLRQSRSETRKTILEGIRLAGSTLGDGLAEFFSNRQEMSATVATISAAALGIYVAKTGTGIAGRFIEARLGRPSLIRETSRRNALDIAKHPIKTLKSFTLRRRGGDALASDASKPQAVFDNALEQRLRRIAASSCNTRTNKAPFRHLLLYGPPGTGKTLFAKGLAHASNMDYAIMTGGDIAPLGREAVSEMHKVFDWAQTSNRGVILFIDEADAFLRRRSTETISEDTRNALNAFLYRTGEQTDRFMVIYASNQPEQFDDAINDRIDELVPFSLPSSRERRRMLDFYMQKYLFNDASSKTSIWHFFPWVSRPAQITVIGVEETHIDATAEALEGFSGREISKLVIAWQAAAYGSENCEFTPEIMMDVLETFSLQKRTKSLWNEQAELQYEGEQG